MLMDFKEVCELHNLRDNLGMAQIYAKDITDSQWIPSEMKKKSIDIRDDLEKMCKELGKLKSAACNKTIKEIRNNPLYDMLK